MWTLFYALGLSTQMANPNILCSKWKIDASQHNITEYTPVKGQAQSGLNIHVTTTFDEVVSTLGIYLLHMHPAHWQWSTT